MLFDVRKFIKFSVNRKLISGISRCPEFSSFYSSYSSRKVEDVYFSNANL